MTLGDATRTGPRLAIHGKKKLPEIRAIPDSPTTRGVCRQAGVIPAYLSSFVTVANLLSLHFLKELEHSLAIEPKEKPVSQIQHPLVRKAGFHFKVW